MKKRFLSNLILLVILNLLIKPFWFFGIEVAVQNRVGEEMYGFYFSLFNFAFILNILLDAGITNFNNRSISREPELLTSYLARIIPLKFLLSIFYGIFVFFAGWLIGYDTIQFRLLFVLVLNQFLSSFILYLRSNISGIQMFRTDSLLSVLDRTLMILFTGLLLWTNILKQPFRIEWFVYTQTLSYTITCLVVLFILLGHSGKIKLHINIAQTREFLRMSYPFALLILLMSFFNRADSVMLERMLPDGNFQAGIYAQSYRILDALSQFSLLFAGLLLPMFSRMLKTGEKIQELVQMAISILLAVSVSVAVISYFFNHEIITLLYHESESGSPKIFSILMVGYIFISISYVYGTLLTANRNLRQLNLLALSTVGLNVGLNLLLIPSHQALGAAISSLSSQAFYAIGQVFIAHRIITIRFSMNFPFRIFLYMITLLITGFVSARLLNPLPALLVITVISVTGAIVTGLIRPKEMLSILLSKEE